MSEEVVYEHVLDKRVTPQTLPPIVEAGDCGFCVLSGICDLPVEDLYAMYYGDKDYRTLGRREMGSFVDRLQREGHLQAVNKDIPIWPRDSLNFASWGLSVSRMSLPWWRYLRMAVEAGYYAISCINIDGKGEYGEGYYNNTDHWVSIVGVRLLDDDVTPMWKRRQLLVSCSSTRTPDETWYRVDHFLRDHGGFPLILVKPF